MHSHLELACHLPQLDMKDSSLYSVPLHSLTGLELLHQISHSDHQLVSYTHFLAFTGLNLFLDRSKRVMRVMLRIRWSMV